jgi:hypothetical protein
MMVEPLQGDHVTIAPPPIASGNEALAKLRAVIMPILEAVKTTYNGRVQRGYPMIVDNVQRGGYFGIALDTGYGLYFSTDGERVWADLRYISERTDTLADGSTEKFAGKSVFERFEVEPFWPVHCYRDIVVLLLARWNMRQSLIFAVDS